MKTLKDRLSDAWDRSPFPEPDQPNLVESFANPIAAARTIGDLAKLRTRLKHTIGISDEDRQALALAILEQENAVIAMATGRL